MSQAIRSTSRPRVLQERKKKNQIEKIKTFFLEYHHQKQAALYFFWCCLIIRRPPFFFDVPRLIKFIPRQDSHSLFVFIFVFLYKNLFSLKKIFISFFSSFLGKNLVLCLSLSVSIITFVIVLIFIFIFYFLYNCVSLFYNYLLTCNVTSSLFQGMTPSLCSSIFFSSLSFALFLKLSYL